MNSWGQESRRSRLNYSDGQLETRGNQSMLNCRDGKLGTHMTLNLLMLHKKAFVFFVFVFPEVDLS